MPPADDSLETDEWRRLDARTVLTYPFAQGGPLVLVLLIAAVVGGAVEALLIRLGVTVIILVGVGAVHWWRFRYRLIDGRLETRAGLVARRSKVINVDRIRGVEIEAKLAHRVAGVCAVRIEHPGAAGGSRGRNRSGRDRIDAVSRAEGERMRNALLHDRLVVLGGMHRPGQHDLAATGVLAGPDRADGRDLSADRRMDPVPGPDEVLLRMPARWLLYAPFSLRLLLLGPAALFAVFNSLQEGGVQSGARVSAATRGVGWAVLAAIGLAVLVLTAVVSGVVRYWRWTVTARGDDVVLARGLLTRRVVAIERRRLRGVILREPLAGRPASAATLQVVLSGVTGSVRSALVPLGPRSALLRFADEFVQPCSVAIARHPRGARTRRWRRGAVAGILLALASAVVAAGGGGVIAMALAAGAVIALAVGLAWGEASYRTLGHAFDERVLTTRHGVLVRHTETVDRSAPIGLRVRQSIFARRAGVASVDVALVARGFTRIGDLGADDVSAVAQTLLPDYSP